MRRRELLLGGSTLLTGLSGCAAVDGLFSQDQSAEPPPLIEVRVVNRDFEPYELSLLIQANGGEIHSWNTYELQATTESEGVKTWHSVAAGTGNMCLDGFLVSASIDGGDSWSQIDGQEFVETYEDISERQGAAAEGEVRDGELTFHPELELILPDQCSERTQSSDATTNSTSQNQS